MWLTTKQIVRAVECFSGSPDRVEVAVSCWGRCVDRQNFWRALYCLSVRSWLCNLYIVMCHTQLLCPWYCLEFAD